MKILSSSFNSVGNKKAILVVSFGTSYNETRKVTIDAIEKSIADTYKDYEIRKAFTSQIIIDKLSKKGINIDNVSQAIEKLVKDKFDTLIVQPTHILNGIEYEKMVNSILPFQNNFIKLKIGKPLLSDKQDYNELINIVVSNTRDYNTSDTAFIFMGHGTEHVANYAYSKLNEIFSRNKYNNYFIGTVESNPTLIDAKNFVKKINASKVILLPLMIVAGDHANNDMAGNEDDSWKTEFSSEGYEVKTMLKGLGEYPQIREMFIRHVKDAIEK